jgi:eukaryotic-like serine/threonine-protein kinase
MVRALHSLYSAMRNMSLEDSAFASERSGEIETAQSGRMENLVAGYPAQLAPHLELKRLLGEGGSSVVFEAFHTRLKVPVAVKLMSVRGAMAQQARARLLREAELYALLDDPRVPRVYDVDELPDGTPFVVMEFVPGNSLETLLLSGPLSPRRAIGIAQEVLSALAYVHSRGVLHRDVKPANVILCEADGKIQVRLVDFGIAKVFDHADQTLTQQGTIVGTPHYMPPERLLGQEAGERADLYSVGVMLYEMLAGAVPFGGPTLGEVIASVLRDEPTPLRTRAPHVSQELERVVTRAMQRYANGRFASAVEMKAALTAVESGFPGESSSPRIVTPTRTQALPSLSPSRRSTPRALGIDTDDYRPPRRRVETTPLLLLAGAAAVGLWVLLPGDIFSDRQVQLEPSGAAPAAPPPAAPLNLEPPPEPALAASPGALLEPPPVAAQPDGVALGADGVADRLSDQFARALGAGGLGEVIEAPAAAVPVEALAGGAAPELAAPGTGSALQPQQPGSAGSALAAPAQGRPARALRGRVARDEDEEDDPDEYSYDEGFNPETSHLDRAAAKPGVPAKSVPLQPLLDKLDKLLKEPAAPVREADEPRPRRGGKVELPANPY